MKIEEDFLKNEGGDILNKEQFTLVIVLHTMFLKYFWLKAFIKKFMNNYNLVNID